MDTKTIDSKSFYRSVLALVVPMALQNLINVAVQSADVIMLGKVGEIQLSAASQAGQVQFVMMLIFFGLASGALVLAAQYWGKGNIEAIEKILAITLRLSGSVALVFGSAALFFPTFLMRIFSPDPLVIEAGSVYLRYVAPSYFCMAFSNTYLNVMRSVEKVIISTVVYSVSLVTNISLNAIFIFGLLGVPAMGVKGAAIATTIARIIEVIVVGVYAANNKLVRIRWKNIVGRDKELMKDFIHQALPTTINELLWGLAIAANSVVIGRLGASAVAANSVAQVARQLATVVCFGLANATAIMVGKAIGSGDKFKAVEYSKRFLRLTLITGVIGGLVIFSIRPFILSFMELTPEARGYLSFLLLYMSVFVVAQGYNTTMVVGVFRGGGDTRFGVYMDAIVMWGGCILWGALAALVFHLPVPIVYVILMSDEFIKIPVTTIRYKKMLWLRDVTRSSGPLETMPQEQ